MAPMSAAARDLLEHAEYVWLTTVRADGMPQPTPVWFLIDGDEIVIFSMPQAQKLRNLRANPRVALSFTGREHAEEFVVIQGTAVLDEAPPYPPAYLAKYAEPMREINYTPEGMMAEYTVRIRVTALHERVQ